MGWFAARRNAGGRACCAGAGIRSALTKSTFAARSIREVTGSIPGVPIRTAKHRNQFWLRHPIPVIWSISDLALACSG